MSGKTEAQVNMELILNILGIDFFRQKKEHDSLDSKEHKLEYYIKE